MAGNGAKRDSRTVQSRNNKNSRHHKPGLISMTVPSGFIQLPKYSSPLTLRLKPGCYPSVDSIMKAITKAALGKKESKLMEKDRSNDSMLSWKIDGVTRRLHVKSNGIVGLGITVVSEDLKNIFCTDVIIDCQSQQRRDETVAPNQLASGTANVVKEIGQWPDDLNAGSNSTFLYCDLVKSETLDDTQTALLRSIPLKSMTLAHTMGEVNHKGSQIYSGSGSSNPNSGPSV